MFCRGVGGVGFGLKYVPMQNTWVYYQKTEYHLKGQSFVVAVQHSLMHRVGRDDL